MTNQLQALDDLTGQLVADKDMHPMQNIWGRKWITETMSGTYRGYWPTPDGMKPEGLFWVFEK